jgi:hypothetical protein
MSALHEKAVRVNYQQTEKCGNKYAQTFEESLDSVTRQRISGNVLSESFLILH